MYDPDLILPLISALAALLFGLCCAALYFYPKISRLREHNIRLTTELEAAHKSALDRDTAFREARLQLTDAFGAMAGDALMHNSTEFLKLAQENLKQFQTRAEGQLAQREKAVEGLVKPIREALDKTEQQMRLLEKERQQAHGALNQQLESMGEAHRLLQGETRNLVQALKRPEVRGQWGELTLKRLVELAGMVEHCDFDVQVTVQGESGPLRPDMLVRMPGGREVVVDAKTSLDAYLAAAEAGNEEQRNLELARHARKVKERVKELAAKAYWQQFENAPDFVVLFVPGEQFLGAALDLDRNLLEFALTQKVILATPTSLVALLRAIAYGWRQETLDKNADVIRKIGQEMVERLTRFAEHLTRLGKSLDVSVDSFNKAVGSFDARILPSARKFTELGVSAKQDVPAVEQVERSARTVETDEQDPSGDDNAATH